MLKAVFFDLDGTLLPLNEDEFSHAYFKLLAEHMEPYGYTKDEIINFVNLGVRAMYLNSGTKTNEEVFWNSFYNSTTKGEVDFKTIFNDFYNTSFLDTIKYTKPNPEALKIINEIKSLGLKVMLTTNPIFPFVSNRKEWAL